MGCETKEDVKELNRLKEKLASDPNNVKLLFKIGMLLFDPFIDMERARPHFEKAIKLEPNNPDLYFWLGYALKYNECAYDEAKKLFEKALSLDPNRAEFYYMMFNVLWDITNDEDEYMKYLLKTIKLQPDWLSPRIQHITCLAKNNEFDKAEKQLNVAYKILEKRHQSGKMSNPNILEAYYMEDGGTYGDYKYQRSGLDLKKKELEKKRKQWDAKQ